MTEDQSEQSHWADGESVVRGLVEEFEDKVYNHCFRRIHHFDLAENVTEEVFARVCQIAARKGIPDHAGLPWLLSIANLILAENHRRLKKQQEILERLPRDLYVDDHSAEVVAKVDAERAMRVLKPALARLSRKLLEVVELRAGAGLTEQETADCLGISIGTVKSRYSRGIEKLRKSSEAAEAIEIIFAYKVGGDV